MIFRMFLMYAIRGDVENFNNWRILDLGLLKIKIKSEWLVDKYQIDHHDNKMHLIPPAD